jgi:hypothetical protein
MRKNLHSFAIFMVDNHAISLVAEISDGIQLAIASVMLYCSLNE